MDRLVVKDRLQMYYLFFPFDKIIKMKEEEEEERKKEMRRRRRRRRRRRKEGKAKMNG
jgi:hypothetical protein